MDKEQLNRQLSLLTDEYDRAAERFCDYSCCVRLPSKRHLETGPRIPRQEKFDPSTMILDVWNRREDAYWRFKELAKHLYPLLQEAGATLITNEDATPDGSVMFWALGNEYPTPAHTWVLTNDNPFWHVAIAVRRLIADEMLPKPPKKKRKVHTNDEWDEFLSQYESEQEDEPSLTETAWAERNGHIPNTVSVAFNKARQRREAIKKEIVKANRTRQNTRSLD